jgi:hypothetical protein
MHTFFDYVNFFIKFAEHFQNLVIMFQFEKSNFLMSFELDRKANVVQINIYYFIITYFEEFRIKVLMVVNDSNFLLVNSNELNTQ